MTLTKFVSAQWRAAVFPAEAVIEAIGDDGETYFIPSMDSDVPPWPQYLADGGEVVRADPSPQPKEPDP